MSHSRPNEEEPIDATPISFCISYDYDIDCGDVIGNPTNLIYFDKEKGFRCQSMVEEVERYENEGIRIQRQNLYFP
ncbi:hypothetical protein JHK87_022650 [Glycine soja]|nr:hypothetical protein JHK87_022650 [Glycine soja]